MADLRSLLVALSAGGRSLAGRTEVEQAARLREAMEEARLQRQIQLEEAREGRAATTRQSELEQMTAEERAQAERILATLRPRLQKQLSGLESPGEISAALQLRKGRGGERKANLKDMVEQIRSVAALGVGPEDLLPRLEAAQQLRGKQRLQAVRSLLNEALQSEGELASSERARRQRLDESLIGRREELGRERPPEDNRLQILKAQRDALKTRLEVIQAGPKNVQELALQLGSIEEARLHLRQQEEARQEIIRKLLGIEEELVQLSTGTSSAEDDLKDLAGKMRIRPVANQ